MTADQFDSRCGERGQHRAGFYPQISQISQIAGTARWERKRLITLQSSGCRIAKVGIHFDPVTPASCGWPGRHAMILHIGQLE